MLVPYLELVNRELLSKFDARNPQSAFADGLLANTDGSVTLGDAYPVGRTATIAALTTRITNAGRAADQRFLPMVNAGNRLSAQNISPLSSTGSATTAQIAIAAHTVQYGFGTVSYGSGTITGLTPLTSYYVYASDPEYLGGAVAYTATTTATTVVSNDGYYFVGGITTANSTPTGNVTAATNALPCSVTVVAHPFTTGQSVSFSGVGGMTQLNGNTYTITKTGADTFTLDGIDASAFGVYTSGGTATRVSTGTDGVPGGGWDPGYSLP
jgi:hypothetical protein